VLLQAGFADTEIDALLKTGAVVQAG